MQSNLEVYSLADRTIVFPMPRPQGTPVFGTRSARSACLAVGLDQIREFASASTGEQIAWLVMALCAFAALGVSFWF